ncbi:alpha/beta fold hydrolase [Rhodococcus sp. NPDC058521]|uniref:alpha/beta fold hydrolase n=1 Tax=Rhodococcus sp. NPDC058521 TaxID=3346536 RepID=UPI003663270C
MPKIGRFTNEEAKTEFFRLYDTAEASWPVPSTAVDVNTSFGTTRVRKSGRGEGAPVVLLPGIGGNGLAWRRFIEALARDHVVYTPDVIGWAGRCVQTAPLHNAEDVARWMDETITGLGEDRVHLAGNSLGAWLSGATAVYRPARIASLTLIEPSAATFAKPSWGLLLKFLRAGIRPTPDRMREFNTWLMPRAELDDEEFAVAMAAVKFRMGMPWDRKFTDEQLSSIAAPSLVLFGAETVVGDPELAADRARAFIPNVETEIYPGIGHDLLWANPEVVIPRFLRFADSHDPVRS